MNTKTRANGHFDGACPKCGGRDRQRAQVRKGGRAYVRASTRMYKRGMRTASRLTRPSLRVYYQETGTGHHAVNNGPTRRFAVCNHPWHDRVGDPLAMSGWRSGGRRKGTSWWPGPNAATPATSVNIHSKDDSRRKAKSRREKAHQGKDRR